MKKTILSAFLLGGCSVLPDPRATGDHLSLPSYNWPGPAPKKIDIFIEKPIALPSLKSTEILLHDEKSHIRTLEDFQWADPLPLALEASLAETLESLGQNVFIKDIPPHTTYTLRTEIRDYSFRIRENTLSIKLSLSLFKGNTLIGHKTSSMTQPFKKGRKSMEKAIYHGQISTMKDVAEWIANLLP